MRHWRDKQPGSEFTKQPVLQQPQAIYILPTKTGVRISLDMDDTEILTALHADHVTVMRINAGIFAVIVILGALALEIAELVPRGVIIIPVFLIMTYIIWHVPKRRYARWGYDMSNDRLRISRGYMFHSDTVVPLGRIQHIDVDQGPIQRQYDLATLSVHTAGSHNDTVSLPGLLHEDAIAMREAIRAHIRGAIR